VLTGVGFLVFLSIFLLARQWSHNPASAGDSKAFLDRVILGMVLMMIGGALSSLGARGWAGSGVILDPSRARRDLKPYSRMAGGMLKDALEDAEVNLGVQPEKVVMIRCRACGRLNEEDSKFCQECGEKI
jgi:RNA polymerase subunit RPABC4/transcription elongation factor Spt4